jgi:hypothetical protein
MNNPDHISQSLETIFWGKILKFFDPDLGSGIFLTLDPEWKKLDPRQTSRIRDNTDKNGTPTKRQVLKRQVSKRLVSQRPVSKRQVY